MNHSLIAGQSKLRQLAVALFVVALICLSAGDSFAANHVTALADDDPEVRRQEYAAWQKRIDDLLEAVIDETTRHQLEHQKQLLNRLSALPDRLTTLPIDNPIADTSPAEPLNWIQWNRYLEAIVAIVRAKGNTNQEISDTKDKLSELSQALADAPEEKIERKPSNCSLPTRHEFCHLNRRNPLRLNLQWRQLRMTLQAILIGSSWNLRSKRQSGTAWQRSSKTSLSVKESIVR